MESLGLTSACCRTIGSRPFDHLVTGLPLDDGDTIRTSVNDAHCDLLQIAVIVDGELCEVSLGSTIKAH